MPVALTQVLFHRQVFRPDVMFEAARLRDKVRDAESGSPSVARLLDRLTAAFDGVPAAPAPLPPAPTAAEAAAMVAREPGGRTLMPRQMLTATTLEELATVYQRPIEEFLRHNQERSWAPDQHLPVGTRVNVPDPGFPRLVAARLSAAVLAGGPPGPALSAQLRHLVPVAGADGTALGTVPARLLLCSPTQDIQLLAELHGLVARAASAIPSGEGNVNLRSPS